MGGRGKLGNPRRWSSWDKRVEVPALNAPALNSRRDVSWPTGRRVPDAIPPRKSSKEKVHARTKTDTGRQVENTKVIEITLVKELGKIAP